MLNRFRLRPLRGVFTGALILLVASCMADSDSDAVPQLSAQAQVESAITHEPNVSHSGMPKDLRAAYIAATQNAAPEAYSAIALEPGRYLMENETQRFGTTFERGQAWITSDEALWSVAMRTSGLGCEEAVSWVADVEPEVDGNRIRYHHGDLETWYVNGTLGLEQGFVIAKAPSCAGTKVVTVDLDGELGAELDQVDPNGRGQAIRLVDAEGRGRAYYADLFVKDARGKTLPAWFTVEARTISIHVDDTEAVYPVEIDPLVVTQQAKLLAGDGIAGDNFGASVSISGDTALVGSSQHDANGLASGAAYIFVRAAGTWTQQAKLLPNDGAAGDNFGVRVSISGDTALIGSYADDNATMDSGSAYVFVRTGGVWSQQAKLMASDGAAGDGFGISVSISGDTALIGTWHDGDNGTDSGSAYIFVRNGGIWSQQAKLLASDGKPSDWFGFFSVSVDADTAVVGAMNRDDKGADSGAAYVFARNGTVWSQEAKLLASDGAAADRFGTSMAVSGDTLLIGANAESDNGASAGSVYAFVRNGGVWTQQAKLLASDGAAGDEFGISVALLGDIAVIGARYDDDKGSNAGSAYIFARVAGAWNEQAKLLANDGAADDLFGQSVSVSMNTIVVGSFFDDDKGQESGSAYVFVAPIKVTGNACTAAAECLSGFCVDGVCCNTACGSGATNDCEACSTATGAAMNGICALLTAGTQCRASAGDCDAAETCNGMSNVCPADAKAMAGSECRASTGACDPAEVCDGMADACPADAKATAGTECRAAADVCDVAEACDGMANACPADTKVAAGTECRATAGPCDVAESCDGASPACPADAVADVTTDCRVAVGPCDIPEKCDGVNKACTPDLLASVGSVCRAAVGECDIAEACTGIDANCPADANAPDGSKCVSGVCLGGTCMLGGGGAGGNGGTGGNGEASSSSSSGGGSTDGGAGGSTTTEEGGCDCRMAGAASASTKGGTFGAALAWLGLTILRRRRAARR